MTRANNQKLLQAINKRELLWIVIPGVTIVFVLIMFLMGLTTSAKGENVKSIELNNYTEETTKSFIFGYSSSPGKKRSSISKVLKNAQVMIHIRIF